MNLIRDIKLNLLLVILAIFLLSACGGGSEEIGEDKIAGRPSDDGKDDGKDDDDDTGKDDDDTGKDDDDDTGKDDDDDGKDDDDDTGKDDDDDTGKDDDDDTGKDDDDDTGKDDDDDTGKDDDDDTGKDDDDDTGKDDDDDTGKDDDDDTGKDDDDDTGKDDDDDTGKGDDDDTGKGDETGQTEQIVDTSNYSQGLINQPSAWIGNLPVDDEIGSSETALTRRSIPSGTLTAMDNNVTSKTLTVAEKITFTAALNRATSLTGVPKIDITNIPLSGAYKYNNVQRVNKIFTQIYDNLSFVKQNKLVGKTKAERVWGYLMPNYNNSDPSGGKVSGVYRYRNFLKAVATFPSLCNDKGVYATEDEACKVELSYYFAHFQQETSQLKFVREIGCYNNLVAGCKYSDAANYSNYLDKYYYGRGAKQLSYPYNYYYYSQSIYGDNRLLDAPDKLADEVDAIVSALWFAMVGQDRKPSIHDIAVGHWVPNTDDIRFNRLRGFGSSTNVINGGIECGSGSENTRAANRAKFYGAYRAKFGLSVDNVNKGCANSKQFSHLENGVASGTWRNYPSGFDQDWSYRGSPKRCRTTAYATPKVGYPLVAGSYKKCNTAVNNP